LPKESHRGRIMLMVGAVAAAAALLWTGILISVDSNSTHSTTISDAANDAPLSTLAAGSAAIPDVAAAAGDATVELRAVTDHGNFTLVGVAVAEGGQVATTAGNLSGLQSISMVGAGGQLIQAKLEGIDRSSDIALIEVNDDLPVPTFADDVSLAVGNPDMTLTTSLASDGSVALHCTPGTVTGIGNAITTGTATGMPGISSSPANVAETDGDLLLNASGAVLGISYNGNGSTPTFLPTQLVLGVADDLRSNGKVSRGWLGIDGSDATGQSGVEVAKVLPGSPAAGHLSAGDVIGDLNSVPIRTMADLKARLYVLAPSTPVTLSVHEGAASHVVGLTLSSSP
jgi:S1-C subfamily serine protease